MFLCLSPLPNLVSVQGSGTFRHQKMAEKHAGNLDGRKIER